MSAVAIMEPRALLEALAARLPGLAQAKFNRKDLCVFSTRVAVQVGEYFHVDIRPLPVRVRIWNDNWQVGIGHGVAQGQTIKKGHWDGHLIAVAGGWFGDFSIGQAERPQYQLITGPAIVGPWPDLTRPCAVEGQPGTRNEGVRLLYEPTPTNTDYTRGPDWRDPQRRKAIVGQLIRELRGGH